MNKDIFQGKWLQIRGEMKKWWGGATSPTMNSTKSLEIGISSLACSRKNTAMQEKEPNKKWIATLMTTNEPYGKKNSP